MTVAPRFMFMAPSSLSEKGSYDRGAQLWKLNSVAALR